VKDYPFQPDTPAVAQSTPIDRSPCSFYTSWPLSLSISRLESVVRIAGIEAGSIAEELHLEIGTRIVRINGQRVRDGIDLTFLLADAELSLETVSPGGRVEVVEIVREEGETVGIVPAPDTVRECANECVFCFIDGNPRDARPSLWLRDDDFRLSFTYGGYVTLTNLGPRGLERLVEQKISPLYVSVHATNPEVRIRLLKNQRAGLIMDQLRFLLDAGLEVHTQAVICPGWNDGPHLDQTMADLFSLGRGVRTLSVVPVGLTKYNVNRPVRLLSSREASDAVAQVERFREIAFRERDHGWVYAADEMYLRGGLPLPPLSYYDAWDLRENGVGAVAGFMEAFEEGIGDVPRLDGLRIRILTGESMEPFMTGLAPRLAEATGVSVVIHKVLNDFYGETVTVAGLLGGRDLLAAVPDPQADDVILLPQEALNADDLFIDSFSLAEFRGAVAPARLLPALELTEALRSL
jgi:putative radical SAM enzyme (TIGR03279 family)